MLNARSVGVAAAVVCILLFVYFNSFKQEPTIIHEPVSVNLIAQEDQPDEKILPKESPEAELMQQSALDSPIQDEVATTESATEFQGAENRAIASLISRNHYLQPDYPTVLLQTASRPAIEQYLSTLDAYSRLASSSEMTFAKMRSQSDRIGPGVDFLFDGSDVLVFPIYGGEFARLVSENAVLLETVNDRKLDVTNFDSYKFLTDIKEDDSVTFKIVEPGASESRFATSIAKSFYNSPARYYRHNNAVVLEVRQFRSGYTGLVRSAISAAEQAELFIIDLRYSPGGDIYAMTDWLSLLLPEDELVAFLHTKRYSNPTELRTLSGQLTLTTPVAILLSRFTASSAEIFAHVLESRMGDRVQTLGEPTKGKCLAQKSFTVNSEFSIVLSTHEVLLADRKSCNGQRLQPEFKLEAIEFQPIAEVISRVSQHSP